MSRLASDPVFAALTRPVSAVPAWCTGMKRMASVGIVTTCGVAALPLTGNVWSPSIDVHAR